MINYKEITITGLVRIIKRTHVPKNYDDDKISNYVENINEMEFIEEAKPNEIDLIDIEWEY